MKFFTHPIKDNKSFKLMLFCLPQISLEITTTHSNPDDALHMIEFNRRQITKREIIKIKYVYGIVVH